MNQPSLDKPGAGLPLLEALFVRYYVAPFQSRRNDSGKNLRLFAMVNARILKEYAAVPAEKRDVKVLVPRMRGIEDSSRFWSPNEVLEHVLITGLAMRDLAAALARGETSDVVVKIENFKPAGKFSGQDAAPGFKTFTDETVELLRPLNIVDGGPAHRHPWLGPLNALQWTWLLSGHGGLHLAQLQAVKKGL